MLIRTASAIILFSMASACSQTREARDEPRPAPATRVSGAEDRAEPRPPLAVGAVVYIISEVAEERAAPSAAAEVLNRIYRGQALTIYEAVDRWVRITADGFQARWVDDRLISTHPPPASPSLVIPTEYRDSRIASGAIPEKASNGLTEEDVLLLWRGAKYMLVHGRCSRVDYADKSTSRRGTYFVQDGNRNIYFTEADLQ